MALVRLTQGTMVLRLSVAPRMAFSFRTLQAGEAIYSVSETPFISAESRFYRMKTEGHPRGHRYTVYGGMRLEVDRIFWFWFQFRFQSKVGLSFSSCFGFGIQECSFDFGRNRKNWFRSTSVRDARCFS